MRNGLHYAPSHDVSTGPRTGLVTTNTARVAGGAGDLPR